MGGWRVLAAGLLVILCLSKAGRSQTAMQRITSTMDGSWTWYEQGVYSKLPGTGLPHAGLISAQSDPSSTFLFQPYNQNNVLFLGPGIHNQLSGTMTFTTPVVARSIAIATSSGWGPDSLMATIHFEQSYYDESEAFISPDWVFVRYFNDPVVATSNGRIAPDPTRDTLDGFQAANNADGPSIAEVVLPVSPAAFPILSIDFTWLASANDTTRTAGGAAIFGISSSLTGTGPFSPVSLTADSFNQDVVVENTVPEPVTGTFAVAFSCMVLRRRRTT